MTDAATADFAEVITEIPSASPTVMGANKRKKDSADVIPHPATKTG